MIKGLEEEVVLAIGDLDQLLMRPFLHHNGPVAVILQHKNDVRVANGAQPDVQTVGY